MGVFVGFRKKLPVYMFRGNQPRPTNHHAQFYKIKRSINKNCVNNFKDKTTVVNFDSSGVTCGCSYHHHPTRMCNIRYAAGERKWEAEQNSLSYADLLSRFNYQFMVLIGCFLLYSVIDWQSLYRLCMVLNVFPLKSLITSRVRKWP